MKILHIFKAEPDDVTDTLVEAWGGINEVTRICLYQKPVDYDQLIGLIFESDRVLCW
ncbi:MAG: hypothetical protein JRG97_12970 [Deltaproteobacteria bacterium]|nr:hypothetical protein [Deltaproteobacteria bacterium]MBW2141960.1 hypothetical protein [Deltaproteobacteria bacterium]MBW2323491.1 hypothetical protein [Deltaproteobacteria bacterium]